MVDLAQDMFPILPKEHRQFPQREREPLLQEVDESGDVIFRFKLNGPSEPGAMPLTEFYRRSLLDLLRVVRLYSGGKPVIVDAFAMLNRPHEPIKLLK